MKKVSGVIVLMGCGLLLGNTGVPVMTANATKIPDAGVKTTLKQGKGYIRSAILGHNIKHRAYKVSNKKGKVYRIKGKNDDVPNKYGTINITPDNKKTKLRVIHHLKNYTKNTWTRTKITQIEHGGHWMMYYYVKSNAKNKAAGWVKLTDVKLKHPNKAGKHIQPEFDIWYRTLNQKQRNWYYEMSCSAATDPEGNPAEF